MVGFFTGQGGIGFTYPQPELEKEILKFVGTKKVYTPDGLFVLEEYQNIFETKRIFYPTRPYKHRQ